MLIQWEYCELVTNIPMNRTGTQRASAVVKFNGESTPRQFEDPAKALSTLRRLGWQVAALYSNVQPDGTVQRHYYLRRSVRGNR